ncbi:unnamed protein product [Calicophoron daubneyi]|uniref:TFIIS N-terminal domain-containing protein n=1 Tax=Calicophoron daubneyi TaxID=300641 RepID=A0AAV2TFM6_CALDB
MYHAVMSNTLNSIMLTLRNGLDTSQNVTNADAVVEAIGQLEIFPMTMNQLQDTRIGQLLQVIRHKVDVSLQKRIRFVIKAWQKLLSPDFTSHSVIPLKCMNTNSSTPHSLPHVSDNRKSNGTPVIKPVSQDSLKYAQTFSSPALVSAVPQTQSPSLEHMDSAPRSLKRTLTSTKSYDIPLKASELSNPLNTSDPLIISNRSVATPNKRLLNQHLSPNTTPSHDSSPSSKPPLLNGTKHHDTSSDHSSDGRPVPPYNSPSLASVPSHLVDTRHVLPPGRNTPLGDEKARYNHVTRLAKVKSTAELVQEAGDCIDSATADRILTNRISKEEDPVRPSVVPQLTRSRQNRNTTNIHRNNARLARSSTCTIPLNSDYSNTTTKLDAHSESTVRSLVTTASPPSAPTFHSLDNTQAGREPIETPTSHFVGIKRRISSDADATPVDTDSDNQKAKDAKKKKKHKHHHKHHSEGSKHSRTHVQNPPITNHLDDWPQLPPLPRNIDWHSLDRPSFATSACATPAVDAVDRLINGPWPSINRTLDDENNLRLPTELYSISLDDQYLHILPWIDVAGHRRKFFPPSSNEDLDQLTELPEPW